MLKLELAGILEQIIKFGSHYEATEMMLIRNKLLDFLRTEEYLLAMQDDENVALAKAAINFIDANHIYASSRVLGKAQACMKPFVDRLLSTREWNYWELRLLIGTLAFLGDVDQTSQLAIKAMRRIADFCAIKSLDVLEGMLASNMCSRLLYAKYFESSSSIDLTEQFDYWVSKIEHLALENWELSLTLVIARIRQAIFKQDRDKIRELLKIVELDTNYSQDMVSAIKSDVDFYLARNRVQS